MTDEELKAYWQKLMWTTERPTVPGWYWIECQLWKAEPCEIFLSQYSHNMWVRYRGAEYSFRDDMRFAGPINQPEEA